MDIFQDFIHKNPQINYSFGHRQLSGSSLGDTSSHFSGHSGFSAGMTGSGTATSISSASVVHHDCFFSTDEASVSVRSFSPHEGIKAPPPTPNLRGPYYGSYYGKSLAPPRSTPPRPGLLVPSGPPHSLYAPPPQHHQQRSYQGDGGFDARRQSPGLPFLKSIADQINAMPRFNPAAVGQPRNTNSFVPPSVTSQRPVGSHGSPTHSAVVRHHSGMGGPGGPAPASAPVPPLNNRNYQEARYKTELCLHFREKNACPHGSRCLFAHGLNELRPYRGRHPKHKTQPCKSFHDTGYCNYGYRCSYIHMESPRTIRYIKSLNEVAQQCRKFQKRALVSNQRGGGGPIRNHRY